MTKYIVLEEHGWETVAERGIVDELKAEGSTGYVSVYDTYGEAVEAANDPNNVVMLNVEE